MTSLLSECLAKKRREYFLHSPITNPRQKLARVQAVRLKASHLTKEELMKPKSGDFT
ncbi:hypothetical protein [Brevibacillus fortis]|uniref:hypothetical protein n=1 Tax=Brevibacillus fortis TaxID=2126352 RepID=UPI0013049B05|nr:hypothetical protein [Brevibacillus fortis]